MNSKSWFKWLQKAPLLLEWIVGWKEYQNAFLNIWLILMYMQHQLMNEHVQFRLNVSIVFGRVKTRGIFWLHYFWTHPKRFSYLWIDEYHHNHCHMYAMCFRNTIPWCANWTASTSYFIIIYETLTENAPILPLICFS